MPQWPAVDRRRDPVLVSCPFSCTITVPARSWTSVRVIPSTPVSSGKRTPVADPLTGSVQQRQQRRVAPGGCDRDELFGHHRVELQWHAARHPLAQLAGAAPPRCVTADHLVLPSPTVRRLEALASPISGPAGRPTRGPSTYGFR